jgi:hypothetical protein
VELPFSVGSTPRRVRLDAPEPRLERVGAIQVVRDDLMPGGTKARALSVLFDMEHREYVYASPVQGYAQVALSHCARAAGCYAHVFCAARQDWHARTREASQLGAVIHEIKPGYLTQVQAAAKAFVQQTEGAKLLPFGLDDEVFIEAMAEVARSVARRLFVQPPQVWSVAGSGVLTRALQRVWPEAEFHAVQIGHAPDVGRAILHRAPERFEDDAKLPPPFPSCSNYDAKAWRFIAEHAAPDSLFWNVAK